MPALTIGIAQEIMICGHAIPQRAIAVTSRVALQQEVVPKSHVGQQPTRGRRQGFADTRNRRDASIHHDNLARTSQIQRGNCAR